MADDERELVALARAGDRQAMDVLVERHYGPLRALLLRYGCASSSDVDDLIQETFLRALATLRRYEDRGHLRTWLFRIALNLARDGRRRSGRIVTQAGVEALAELSDLSTDPAGLLLAKLDGQALAAALDRLPESQRAVLVLRFYADLPIEEVARVCGCPEGTVKSRIHYALRKLRGLLTREPARGEQVTEGEAHV